LCKARGFAGGYEPMDQAFTTKHAAVELVVRLESLYKRLEIDCRAIM